MRICSLCEFEVQKQFTWKLVDFVSNLRDKFQNICNVKQFCIVAITTINNITFPRVFDDAKRFRKTSSILSFLFRVLHVSVQIQLTCNLPFRFDKTDCLT